MSFHICIHCVVFSTMLFYAANTEFLFDILDKSECNLGDLELCSNVWICYCWLIGRMRHH
jgi:hypothetical protein